MKHQFQQITPREKEVLDLIAYEHSSKEIARKLYVSQETVNSHRKNMMDKLGVRNTAGLVRVAFERGLMRVGQVAMVLVFLSSIGTFDLSAQVENENINFSIVPTAYSLRTGGSETGSEEIVFRFMTKRDVDNSPTQLTWSSSTQNCRTWTADCENQRCIDFGFSGTWMNETNSPTSKFDWTIDSWEDDSEHNCTENFIPGTDEDQGLYSGIIDVKVGNEPNIIHNIVGNSAIADGPTNPDRERKVDYKVVWRYAKGNSGSTGQPLDFGIVGSDNEPNSKSHINSNRINPDGNLNRGYQSLYNGDYAQSSPDVFYKFEITEKAKRVVISTDHDETDFDTYLILMKDGTVIDFNDDGVGFPFFNTASLIAVDLCPGTYTIVVEGSDVFAATKTGDFKLSVSTSPVPSSSISPGTIQYNGPASLCAGKEIPNIEFDVNPDITWLRFGGEFETHEWWSITGNVNGEWDSIGQRLDFGNLNNPGIMGDEDISFRRRTRYCGVWSRWTNVITIQSTSSTNNPGVIKYQDNETQNFVRKGYLLPADITNVTSAVVDPTPGTYRWEKKEGISDYEVIDNATSEFLTPSQLGPIDETILIRRVSINGCQSDSASNVLTIEAVEADGVIEGTITPPLSPTTGIAGVRVCAEPLSQFYGIESECDTTDNDGKYRFSNLYYGKQDVTYRITPILEDHVIRVSNNVEADSTKDIAIGITEGKNKIQNFFDLTSYTLSGNISHLFDGVEYGMGGVDIFLDNKNDPNDVPLKKGTTDNDGKYSIAIGSPGMWTITPRLLNPNNPAEAHVFNVISQDVEVLEDITGVDFIDQTEKRLTAFIGAGCDQYLGSVQLRLMENPSDGPFSITLITDNEGRIDKMLPARNYKTVQILDASISNANLTNDFDPFVEDVKVQYGTFSGHESLMTFSDDDINVVYRAPLTIDLTDVPASSMGCDGNPLYDFPKLDQSEFYPDFKIKVFEGLIRGSNACPLDTGFVDVTDGIGDRGSGRVAISDGEIEFLLLGGTPKIEAPHTKRLDFNAQSLNPLATGADTSITAIVVGQRPRTKKLNTVTPELPLFVLHDPPGDLSYAFLESGQTQETTTRFYSKKATVRDSWDNIKIGSEASYGIGQFVTVSTNVISYGQMGEGFESNRSDVSINETIIGVSTTDRYQTDSNPNSDVIGDEGDVFVGGAYNMITALTDTINFSNTCELELGVSLFISPDRFATTYIKTARAIANDIMSFNETIEVMESNGENSSFLKAQVDVWEQMLDNNQKKKDRAKITDANFVENLTFSGSIEKMSSTTTTKTEVNTIEFLMELDTSILGEYQIEIAGNGVNGGYMTKFKTETGDTDINTSRSSFTTGYFLHDDDPDDDFSVDVYTDLAYRTPMFKVRDESKSSCPVEAGTQSLTQFTVETTTPGSLSGINPASEGEYTIRIANLGSQTTTFVVSNDDAYNANAAMVSIGGNAPGIDGSVEIIAGQSADVVVRVSKAGSSQVFSYPDLHINIEPACGGTGDKNALKFINLSAYFTSLCSNITLFAPSDGTLVSSQLNNPTLEIQMKDYEVSKIGSVALEHRPKGQGSWTPSSSVFLSQGQMSTIGASPTTVANWNVSEAVGDGEYELRLKVVCPTGINYSSLRTINVNREGPQPIGIPSPIDDVYDLSANDEISVFYNEEIACNNGSAVIVNLLTNDTIGTVGDMLVCFSNKLTIVPQTALPPASVFRVIVSGVTDIYGNISDTYRWVFTTPGYNFDEVACLPDLEISNNNENQDAISVTAYRALAISSNGLIPGFGLTSYTAQEEVNFGSGFEVTEGGILEAQIENCDE